jgi:NitT/TauT family transport system permease protein
MTLAFRPPRVPARWVRGAAGAATLLVGLELLTRAEIVTPVYLPRATSILRSTFDLLTTSAFLGDLWFTLQACLIGLAIATVVAVPLGLVLGLGQAAYKATIVVIEFLRPIPSVALIPLAILLYGRGTDMKVALVVFACVWPILFNTIYGMHSVDPVAADTARAFGLGRFSVGRRVYLRSASPFIFTGFKIAVSVAVIVAVSAEIIAGGSDGIGIVLSEAASVGDQRTVYAITIVTGLLGLVLLGVLSLVERKLFAWSKIDGAAS